MFQWASAYFDALVKGEKPPAKERLDFQFGAQGKSLTKEAVAVLHGQLGEKPIVELSTVEDKWYALCLPKEDLNDIMRLGSFAEEFEWLKFLVLTCSHIAGNITTALQIACEVITKDLEGGRARVDFLVFKYLYEYLATIDGDIPASHVKEVLDHLAYDVERQDGMIGPINFTRDTCPSLFVSN